MKAAILTPMTVYRCRRCDQVLSPGTVAPWCLGGSYRCDTSTAYRAMVVPMPVPVPVPAMPRETPGQPVPGPARTGSDQEWNDDPTVVIPLPVPDRDDRDAAMEDTGLTDHGRLVALAQRDGVVPSIGAIRTALGCGSGRAKRMQAAVQTDTGLPLPGRHTR